MAQAGDIHQLEVMVDKGLIELILDTVKENGESNLLISCFKALEAIMDEFQEREEMFGSDNNPVKKKLALSRGYEIIEKAQIHVDEDVYNAVSSLIESHFEVQEYDLY